MKNPKVLLLVSLSHAVNHVNSTAITFLVSVVIASELGLSTTEVGLVASAALFTSGFSQLLFGVAGRYYAKRVLLAAGNGMMGLGSILTGLATNVGQLTAFRLIWGFGSAPQHPLGASLISDNFESKLRGRALGIHSGISYLGNIAGPVVGLALSELLGWRTSLFTLAIPMLIMTLPLLRWIREIDPKPGNAYTNQSREKLTSALSRTSRDRNVILITTAQAVLAGGRGLGVTLVFLPIFLTQELAFDRASTALFTVIFLVGGSAGPLLYGWLSDRMGRKPVALATILATGLLNYLIVVFSGERLSLVVVLFALGSVSFAVTSILQAYLSETTDSSVRDIAFGLYFTIGFGLTSVWTIIIGTVIDLYGFVTAFIVMAAFSAPAAACVMFVSEKREVTEVPVIAHHE